MAGRLDGRTAVVTGGGSGIGLATGARFASEGANVVVVDLDPAAGQAAADQVGGLFVKADVSDADDVARALGAALDEGLDAHMVGDGADVMDDLLLRVGLLEPLSARLEIRAEATTGAARAASDATTSAASEVRGADIRMMD